MDASSTHSIFADFNSSSKSNNSKLMEIEVKSNAKKAQRVVIDEEGKKKYYYGPPNYRRQWERIPECRGKYFVPGFFDINNLKRFF